MGTTLMIICLLTTIDYNLVQSTFEEKAAELPRIWFYNLPQEVEVGSTVRMVCGIENKEGYPVMWIKNHDNNEVLVSADSKLLIEDDRYSLIHHIMNSTWGIEIRSLQLSDEGSYICRVPVENSEIDVSATIVLKLLIPPKFVDGLVPLVEVYEGQPCSITCAAIGSPRPLIFWMREDKGVLWSGGRMYPYPIYVLYNTAFSDNGTYYCYAYNGVNESLPAIWKTHIIVKRIFD